MAPIAGVWFDGMWDKPNADWHLDKTYALIHQLQPAALIIPNHHQKPRPGEDAQTFERDLPGDNTAGFKHNLRQRTLFRSKAATTLNGSWGFNIGDTKYKSPEEIEEMLVRAAGNNSNLLLNIGPLPNGEIQDEFQTRLRTVGEWLAKYGGSIYGTRGGPLAPADWGVTTQTVTRIYVHVLKWNAPAPRAPSHFKVNRRRPGFGNRRKVDVAQSPSGVVLNLPAATKSEVDRVIVLSVN